MSAGIKTKILIVDDEDDLRELLASEFEFHGYEVYAAESGTAAMMVLDKVKVDIVLSDVRMPNGNGVWLLQQIRGKFGTSLPVFFLTGFSDINEEKAVKLDSQGLFHKPFRFPDVLRGIQTFLAAQKSA